MTPIQQKFKSFVLGRRILVACLVGLILSNLIPSIMGVSDSEVYKVYSWPWWLGVGLVGTLIWAVIFTRKKSRDLNPDIQLGRRPDEYLKQILGDPEYHPWHSVAERLLRERNDRLQSNTASNNKP